MHCSYVLTSFTLPRQKFLAWRLKQTHKKPIQQKQKQNHHHHNNKNIAWDSLVEFKGVDPIHAQSESRSDSQMLCPENFNMVLMMPHQRAEGIAFYVLAMNHLITEKQ